MSEPIIEMRWLTTTLDPGVNLASTKLQYRFRGTYQSPSDKMLGGVSLLNWSAWVDVPSVTADADDGPDKERGDGT